MDIRLADSEDINRIKSMWSCCFDDAAAFLDIRIAERDDYDRIKSMWIGNGSVSFTISSSNF